MIAESDLEIGEYRQQLKQKSTDELIQIALTAELEGDDPGWDAIWELRLRATPDVFEAASALCLSFDPSERVVGVDILAQLGTPGHVYLDRTLDILCKLIETETVTRVLSSIAVGLGHISPEPRKVKPLLRLKDHSDPDVRQGVAFGLSGEDDPLAIQALIALSADVDMEVRDWATFALGSQTNLDSPQIREALYRRVIDPNDAGDAPGEGLVGLARRGDARAFVLTLGFIQSGNAGTLVFEAAEMLADARLHNALVMLRYNPRYNEYQRHCLEDAIAACAH